jgi:hypothetical protein
MWPALQQPAAHLQALVKARLGHHHHLAILHRMRQLQLEQRQLRPAQQVALRVQQLRRAGVLPEQRQVGIQRAAQQVAQLVALQAGGTGGAGTR